MRDEIQTFAQSFHVRFGGIDCHARRPYAPVLFISRMANST
jgi:hypothetical protein